MGGGRFLMSEIPLYRIKRSQDISRVPRAIHVLQSHSSPQSLPHTAPLGLPPPLPAHPYRGTSLTRKGTPLGPQPSLSEPSPQGAGWLIPRKGPGAHTQVAIVLWFPVFPESRAAPPRRSRYQTSEFPSTSEFPHRLIYPQGWLGRGGTVYRGTLPIRKRPPP